MRHIQTLVIVLCGLILSPQLSFGQEGELLGDPNDLDLVNVAAKKIEVDGEKARLFVNGDSQPCLIVNDLKRGGQGGAVALWLEQSTDAYFRNLRISNAR